MQKAIEILPKRAPYRFNLALYHAYAGDFQTAEQEARAAQPLNPSFERGYLTLAYAQLGQGQVPQASETYQKLEKLSANGASIAASGLADIAVYEGRYADSARILEKSANDDVAAKKTDAAADKFAALAYVQLLRGQKAASLAAAENALANSKAVKFRFLASRILIAAGEPARAKPLAASLGAELQAEPQAYAKLIDGEAALKGADPRQAIKTFTEANGIFDTWIGHFDLGRAYLEAGAFTEADSEFDQCIKRRGEALELFMDDVATYGYFPAVYYYQGRAREGLKSSDFAQSYRQYLSIREKAGEDPLLADVRNRVR
jgi:Flp pilus assembly protein TadD